MTSKRAPEYQALSEYLVNRYAGTIVMRLSEIEDILGFRLPVQARLQPGWWSNHDSDQSGCWGGANRAAHPNLTAQTVTFTRAEA